MNCRRLADLVLVSAFLCRGALADELAPLESYGNLPVISSMALSPDGDRIAYRFTRGEQDFVVAMDLAHNKIVGSVDVTTVKPRGLYFVDEDHVLLVVSKTAKLEAPTTARLTSDSEEIESSRAFVLDVSTNELRQLLNSVSNLWSAQTGLGRVVGLGTDPSRLFMPAFVGNTYPSYSLFEVQLDRDVERRIARGTSNTIDWFLDAAGRPYVEEEFDNTKNPHRIWVHDHKDRRMIYEKETEIPAIQLVGLTADRKELVFESTRSDTDTSSHYHMSLQDGTVTGPFYQRDDADVESTLTDLRRIVYGVEYSGFLPTYEFADPELTKRVRAVQDTLKGTAAELIDWTPNFDRLLFHVSGGWSSDDYVIAGRGFANPTLLVRGRPDIAPEQVEPTTIIQYEARDGVTIPALLTYNRAAASGGKLPLIVLPHGGPAAHDRFGFDWIAQYFASRGYAVLQPQFRGSTGFGRRLLELGKGEWGARMSTDLDDGVQWLIHRGVADPDRVAIVGASYGGYAALAAGAFSPLDYKCIVSIAGVSDLPTMLTAAKQRYGRDHWAVEYWQGEFGSDEGGREQLEAISPAEHAENFRAPVLLVHGKDDTVVEIDQSVKMYRALNKAGKDVTFVRLDGEDHWLSSAETRIEALKAVAEFIQKRL